MMDDYTLYEDDWNEFIRRGIESFYSMEVRDGKLAYSNDAGHHQKQQVHAQGGAGQGGQAAETVDAIVQERESNYERVKA